MDDKLLFTGEDLHDNWFYNNYYYAGSNSRYHTFQIVLNLLNQRVSNPLIIETGCQRLEDDLGGGMSTSIFAEYINRYGGKLITVDINQDNLNCAKRVTEKFSNANIEFHCSDSAKFLSEYSDESPDLLYLDSWDYPYGEILNNLGGQEDLNLALEKIRKLSREQVVQDYESVILPCQEHTVKEFKSIQPRLNPHCLLLIDDNQLAGGGKSRLLKEYLLKNTNYKCLIDFQQSLWVNQV